MLLLLPSLSATAATITNNDRNLHIRIQDALETQNVTRLLYFTMPDITQAHVHEKCTTNFYTVDLKPGLADTRPQLLAENYCAHSGMSASITTRGDVIIIADDRVETWRPGAGKIKAWSLAGIKWPEPYKGTIKFEDVRYNVSPEGELLVWRMRSRKRNDTTSPSGIVVRTTTNGDILWQQELHSPGVLLNVIEVWASEDGGALLLVSATPLAGAQLSDVEAPAGSVISQQNRLYRLDANGSIVGQHAPAAFRMPDPSAPMVMPDLSKIGSDPDAFKAILERQQTLTTIENVDQLAVRQGDNGRLDILYRRGSSDKARDGTVYQASAADGTFSDEWSVQAALDSQRLRTWVDFAYVDGSLLLYGVAGTRANRLPQGYVAHIDPGDNTVQTRLAPLNTTGLDEARHARDEQVQTLAHNPSQEAVLLGSLAGKPLLISLIRLAQRPAIQLDEVTATSPLYDPSQQ